MALVDFILNVAALLLWVNWRSLGMPAAIPAPGISLLSTLKRAEARPVRRWSYLATLVLILLLRPFLYNFMGSAINWSAPLRLGAVALYFRSDMLDRMFLYSGLSFLWFMSVFYFSLNLLAALNHDHTDSDTWQRLVRLHLGPMGRWPWGIHLVLPLLVAAGLWAALANPLSSLGILTAPHSPIHLAQQAAVIGVCAVLSWKYVLIAALLLHLVNSYVYLGNHSFWNYVKSTAKRILWPIQKLPLTLFKLDFAPLIGIALIWIGCEYAERGLAQAYASLPWL